MQHPVVQKISKRQWRLVQDFYHAPSGFVTDGASVPRFLWWFMDPAGEAFEAAILHDYDLIYDTSPYKINSHVAFRQALITYGVTEWKADIAFLSVLLYHIFKSLTIRGPE